MNLVLGGAAGSVKLKAQNHVRAEFETIWSEKSIEAYMLSPLSLLYAVGWTVYAGLYASGFKQGFQPEIPTICVGNLPAGGTGKTPFCRRLALDLLERGHQVVVGASGYGSPAQHGAKLAPDGPLDPAEWGDEPALYRWSCRDFPLIIGRDRVLAAQIAAENFPHGVLLMDDGFQHLKIKPHLSIVIEPDLHNNFCFPAGPYREPKSIGHRRANRVLHHSNEELTHIGPSFYNRDHQPIPAPAEVDLLTAIGNPWRLLYALDQRGITVKERLIKTDHDKLNAAKLFNLFSGERPLLVTLKDYVKIAQRPDIEKFDLVIADYELCAKDPDFVDWVEGAIRGKA